MVVNASHQKSAFVTRDSLVHLASKNAVVSMGNVMKVRLEYLFDIFIHAFSP